MHVHKRHNYSPRAAALSPTRAPAAFVIASRVHLDFSIQHPTTPSPPPPSYLQVRRQADFLPFSSLISTYSFQNLVFRSHASLSSHRGHASSLLSFILRPRFRHIHIHHYAGILNYALALIQQLVHPVFTIHLLSTIPSLSVRYIRSYIRLQGCSGVGETFRFLRAEGSAPGALAGAKRSVASFAG